MFLPNPGISPLQIAKMRGGNGREPAVIQKAKTMLLNGKSDQYCERHGVGIVGNHIDQIFEQLRKETLWQGAFLTIPKED